MKELYSIQSLNYDDNVKNVDIIYGFINLQPCIAVFNIKGW